MGFQSFDGANIGGRVVDQADAQFVSCVIAKFDGRSHPEIPFNDSAAVTVGDSTAAIGGGAGDGGVGNLLDVFA